MDEKDLEPLKDPREVTYEQGIQIASEWKCPYIEASTVTSENILKAFQIMIAEIIAFRSRNSKFKICFF